MSKSLLLFSIATVGRVLAQGPFDFCTDGGCQNCPVSLTSEGSGYPNCVVYNSGDIFPGASPPFATSPGGGYEPFFNVFEPQPGCKTIVKSPASTDEVGCGKPIGIFSHAVCATTSLENTFMVQFCCGDDQCSQAGALPSKLMTRSGVAPAGGAYLKYANGTIIPPAAVAPMKMHDSSPALGNSAKFAALSKRAPAPLAKRAACDNGSWRPDSGMEKYTRPADGSELVYQDVPQGATVSITTTRSVSYTQSMSAGLSFEDILNIGVEFSMTEETSRSSAISYTAPQGQTGNVEFTAILTCSTGTGTCNGADTHGEICTGSLLGDDVYGEYSIAVTS